MSAENASYIMTECEHTGELMLTTSCHRAGGLARSLCRRVARPNGSVWRYYFSQPAAQRWLRLMDAGYHAVKHCGSWRYTRDPRPVRLTTALKTISTNSVTPVTPWRGTITGF